MCVKVQFFTLKCESKLAADLVDYNDIAVLLTFQDRLLLIHIMENVKSQSTL